MQREHITGKFNLLGISSKEKQIDYYLEEFKIRKKNNQNLFYISLIFLLKNVYYYLFKINFIKKIIRSIKRTLKINY